jgi:hypothetical protein
MPEILVKTHLPDGTIGIVTPPERALPSEPPPGDRLTARAGKLQRGPSGMRS